LSLSWLDERSKIKQTGDCLFFAMIPVFSGKKQAGLLDLQDRSDSLSKNERTKKAKKSQKFQD